MTGELKIVRTIDELRTALAVHRRSGATIGVIALFEEQAALLQELVAERIPEDEWKEHDLVVVTPDGFQGDERALGGSHESASSKVTFQAPA